MKWGASIVVVAVLASFCGRPGTAGASAVVTLVPPAPVTVAPGDTVTISLAVTIADGYHVQANPAGDEFLIPLEIRFDAAPDVVVSSIVYPDPVPFRLEGTSEDLPTYEKAAEIHVSLTVAAEAKRGKRALAGQLHYQACDARRCLFPAAIPVTIRIVVPAQ